jgi:pantoate--beta-alanine ligase
VELVHSARGLREHLAHARSRGSRIALVPTMGNLHEGHLSLVDAARTRADVVVATVFVNPLQFGPNEDYDAYPRTLDADRRALAARGADVLFAPAVAEMYPDGPVLATRVTVAGLSGELCGADRPGHFDGVTTVVAKLFQLVQPDLAVFGRKDLQQLTLIRTMVRDLSMPLAVIGVETVRAGDGLALSSRNGYLSEDERARAPALRRALVATASALDAGRRDYATLEADARRALEGAGLYPDYVAVRRARDLAAPDTGDDALVVLGAARLGSTRLIDNATTEAARRDERAD